MSEKRGMRTMNFMLGAILLLVVVILALDTWLAHVRGAHCAQLGGTIVGKETCVRPGAIIEMHP